MPNVDAPVLCPIPPHMVAPGSPSADFTPLVAVADLPVGGLRRVSFGDLDLVVAATTCGIVVTDDRCPHMAAPLSLGTLDGCIVACVLHRGSFDLSTGETATFPTTGGLDADGVLHAPWAPAGTPPKPEPSASKAQARTLTRTRRLRFYPTRVRAGILEARVPGARDDVDD
ncbi:MAG TPA: Rieske 2Fe-2S domain-containing protein [Candidatus Acidoferrales bacterium]|nr:Rieske 2Fe-2S domain-containing protein [Candidatus Acidoferrales bacterium]